MAENISNDYKEFIIWGPPGTGKTTELAQKTRRFVDWSQKKHPHHETSVMICSLTKTAAAEIAGRDLPLPDDCVGTLHSHAYRALGNPEIAEAHAAEFSEKHPVWKLSSENDSSSEPSWDRRTTTEGDQLILEYNRLRGLNVPRERWSSAKLKAFTRAWDFWKGYTGYLDFTDLIERALDEVDAPDGLPLIVIADEGQDYSTLEYHLARKWGQNAGNFIIAGDPDQSIYGWRGADPDIFHKSSKTIRIEILKKSFRIPSAIYATAMKWRDQLSNPMPLKYAPRDAEGSVTQINTSWKHPDQVLRKAERYAQNGKRVMIMASCSFFLSPTVRMMRKRGIPFSNPWRRKRGDWNPMAKRGRGTSMIDRMLALLRMDEVIYGAANARLWSKEELYQWINVMKSDELLNYGAKAEIKKRALLDEDLPPDERKPVNPEDIFEWFGSSTRAVEEITKVMTRKWTALEVLQWWGRNLLARYARSVHYPLAVARQQGASVLRDEPKIHIGTIHSFKGAEADVVFLFPDLSPSGYNQWCTTRQSMRDAVVRLFYVGITRAKETLILCSPTTGMCVPWGRIN